MASLAQLSPADGLPSSVHTEVAILGAMLLDGIAITTIGPGFRPIPDLATSWIPSAARPISPI